MIGAKVKGFFFNGKMLNLRRILRVKLGAVSLL